MMKQIIEKHFSTADQLKNTPITTCLDLLIFLQRPSKRNNWIRKDLLPLLQDRTKNLSQQNLENYIRRTVNLEDVTPVHDSLSMIQSRNILDFLLNQENIGKVQPTNLYALVERIISDGKITSKDNDGKGFSQLLERHRVETLINQVFNKIPREYALLTEQFVEAMLYTSMNLSETPNYFLRTIKHVLSNGVPVKKEGEESG
jgi:hypothetical protein